MVAFGATTLAYICAAMLYLAYLSRGDATSVRWASRALAAAVLAHLGYLLGARMLAAPAPTGGIRDALALLSIAVAFATLVTVRRPRMAVLGAFLVPVALLLLLGTGLGGSVPSVPPQVRSALLPLHIGVNVLGIAAFALAFAAALGYLVQERLLRSKRVVGMFQRLPALDVLDAFGLRLVTLGFPLFTIGIVTGTVWATKSGTLELTTGQGFAMLAWASFAAVLLARAAAGWRGRRAAIGTLFGFGCTMAAIAGYLLGNPTGT